MSRKLTPEEQRLCEDALPMVPRLASRLAFRYPSVERTDLESAGHEALVRAVEPFDQDSGTFERYAFCRVEGAMLDTARRALRQFGRESRGTRCAGAPLAPELPAGVDPIMAALEEGPTDERQAALADLRTQAAGFVSAELLASGSGEEVIDSRFREQALAALRQAAGQLGEPERTIFRMWFQEEASTVDVAQHVGVSPRTVQRHVDRIRQMLAEKLEPLLAA